MATCPVCGTKNPTIIRSGGRKWWYCTACPPAVQRGIELRKVRSKANRRLCGNARLDEAVKKRADREELRQLILALLPEPPAITKEELLKMPTKTGVIQ